jgi:periplasmic protein TonB
MDTNKILSASLLDIVFEGRNKDYGAYELRVTYPERIKKSLLVIITLAAVIFGGSVLGNSMKPSRSQKFTSREVVIESLKEEEKKEKEVIPIKKPEVQEPVRTIQVTPPVITDEPVTEPIPEENQINDTKIDVITKEGVDETDVYTPPDDKRGIIEAPKTDESDKPLMIVEIPAKYIGNWESFLLRNLNPEVPVMNGAAPGRYRVIIQFVVDKDGNVSDIKALTSLGFGMEEEAMRVIKKATRWEPAIQNGYKQKAYHKQPITFEVNEDN